MSGCSRHMPVTQMALAYAGDLSHPFCPFSRRLRSKSKLYGVTSLSTVHMTGHELSGIHVKLFASWAAGFRHLASTVRRHAFMIMMLTCSSSCNIPLKGSSTVVMAAGPDVQSEQALMNLPSFLISEDVGLPAWTAAVCDVLDASSSCVLEERDHAAAYLECLGSSKCPGPEALSSHKCHHCKLCKILS